MSGENSDTVIQPLSTAPWHDNEDVRYQIVRLLDLEPLFAYLVQNGVLTTEDVDDITSEPELQQQNRLLMKFIEARPNGVLLFTNVLRQTGQHFLANLLDDGVRIRAPRGSGYFTRSRHKGQVNLLIRVKSLRLADDCLKSVTELLHKEWISLEDIQVTLASLKISAYRSLNTSQQSNLPELSCVDASRHVGDSLKMAPSLSVVEESEEESKGCCSCFGSAFSKRKKQKSVYLKENMLSAPRKISSTDDSKSKMLSTPSSVQNSNVNSNTIPRASLNSTQKDRLSLLLAYHENNLLHTPSASGVSVANGSTLCIANGNDASINDLRIAANSLQNKCEELYAMLCDGSTPVGNDLLRYFEQNRGILVLCGVTSDGVDVQCMCTKTEHLTKLKDDFTSGNVLKDLERIVVTETVLQALGATGLKLEVDVAESDFESAKAELSK